MNPLISIIVPVYNVQDYIEQCIKSIMKQSYSNIEIICINDGSTDNSLNILRGLQKIDNRVRVMTIKNQGVSNARNEGIISSKGKYLLFIDSDDYIPIDYVMCLYHKLLITNSQLCICSIKNFGYSESSYSLDEFDLDMHTMSDSMWLKLNKSYLLYGPCNKIYNSNIIKKNNIQFNINLNYGEDLVFNYEYMKYVNKISYTNETSYHYRRDTVDSLSKKFRVNQIEIELILNKVMQEFVSYKNLDKSGKFKDYLNHRLFDCVYNYIFSVIRYEKFTKQYKLIYNALYKKNINLKYNDEIVINYSKIIVFLMKYKLIFLLLIWIKFRMIGEKV